MSDKAMRVLELQAEFATNDQDRALDSAFPDIHQTTRTKEEIAADYAVALRDLLSS